MNILLVCPRYRFEGYTPTGLASIAAIAKSLGHKVKVIDMNIEPLPKDDYDLVGITGLSLWKKQIIETSKKLDEKPVIVGGPWASLYPYDALSNPSIDYVCVGEGEEETFRDFLLCYPNVEKVESIGYKAKEEVKLNQRRPFISNLDSLPFPAWYLLKLRRYRRVSVVTSRGCPYNCIFCSDHTLLGRRWRARSVASVVSEIEMLVTEYGVKHITFGDENMTLIPERFEQICETLIKKGVKAEFDAIQGVRADKLSPKLLELMKKAGFTEIIIAPESGSQRVLDEVIHKNLDLSVVEHVVRKCKEIGLRCGAFFVIGFSWETMEEIQETVKFADKLRGLG
ncbi:MAG: radical SAM protein [Candidatus Bathyarchaeia archaeon]|nr:radical SAM protein [Candidatus Bathyarchaeia archaeon]